ncbi:barstar family protein [Hansschlegelia zhihuaiae]|uniref:Barstar (barnase inhibitor) domain-containing protein n=1 Tax=Hansschlegelia zhihuaiae TaxID=405005 RepID=A0A4Q0MIP0_9HYPH|nr:barstar family protein [Hansschlegelia zhihuaiae]RXF73265.1 hypothetical protein EK403_10520 [Hansschlegelia zhihuaiae]
MPGDRSRSDPSGFRYEADLTGRVNGKSFYWRVPGDIRARQELFAAFSGSLWFPRDGELDWDALFERLCDLDWMADRKVVLVHDALPRLPDEELRVYLTVLRDAVRWWRFDEPHELEVVFPETERERIERLLAPVEDQP